MGLRLKTEQKITLVSLNDMEQGDIGIVKESDVNDNIGIVVAKAESNTIICLDSGYTWGDTSRDTTKVDVLPPGTEFVID